MILVAMLWLALPSAAQSHLLPICVGFRYSEQVSNVAGGNKDRFALEGAAADAYWKMISLPSGANLGLAVDGSMENTHDMNGAGYGLNLFSFAGGPRFKLSTHSVRPFVQALFGVAHGWGSEFPSGGNKLASSASSFALDLGAGADYPLNKRLSLRVLQVDYSRSSLPNNTTNWQNNLRIGAGLTLRLAH
jgi:opacity protein-like surface antigen